jgi:hypothetical protein
MPLGAVLPVLELKRRASPVAADPIDQALRVGALG